MHALSNFVKGYTSAPTNLDKNIHRKNIALNAQIDNMDQ